MAPTPRGRPSRVQGSLLVPPGPEAVGSCSWTPSSQDPQPEVPKLARGSRLIWLLSTGCGPQRLGLGAAGGTPDGRPGSPGPALPGGSDSSCAEDSWPYKAVCGHLLGKLRSPQPCPPPVGAQAWPGAQRWRRGRGVLAPDPVCAGGQQGPQAWGPTGQAPLCAQPLEPLTCAPHPPGLPSLRCEEGRWRSLSRTPASARRGPLKKGVGGGGV